MYSVDFIILLIASIANLLVGLFIFLKNYKDTTHQLFALLTITLVGWTAANYISVAALDEGTIYTAIQVVLSFVVLQNSLFFLFTSSFPNNRVGKGVSEQTPFVLFSLATLIASIYPGFFSGYITQEQLISPQANPFIALFMLHLIISVGGGFYVLKKRYHEAKSELRKQLQLLLLSAMTLYLLAPIFNFIFPALLGINSFLSYAPIYTFAFSAVIGYTIVRHKLFDIRAAVARTVAYILALGFIGLVYGTFLFVVFSIFESSKLSQTTELVIFITLTLLTSVAYPLTKKYFDRVTTKLFYQDAYDSQEFLDEINTLLVGQIELEQLLKGITDVIEQNLKSEYCVFVVRETAYEGVRIVGSENHTFNENKIKELRLIAPHTHQKVLATDELAPSDEQLKAVQDSLDIAVLIRLISNANLDTEGMGYLVLGPKKNGTAYTAQDRQVLNILANEMIIAVENALRFEEIEKFNITLQDKVDSATSELKRTNEKLKEMDETKDEFISMASHQLRTPLTSVKGYLSMVLEGDVGKITKQQDKMLEQAFLSSQRMVYLIADLLNVSRLKTGKFIIDSKETNLADVVETEVMQLQPTAKSRKLSLAFQKPKNFPTLYLDETKMRQVIMNFIDNAIYYTPAGGKVEVQLSDKGETIECVIKDNGIGVPKAERHNLFSKFYRAGNARSARPDGTGLGLFMAKKVVVAQGGAIIFESEEGKGSTFGFTFSKNKLQTPPKAEDAADKATTKS